MEDQKYAGFWIRFGATLIDLIIMTIVLYVPLTLIYGEEYWLGNQFIHGFWDVFLGYVVPAVATIWFWLRFFGTPGKMVTRLKIVDAKTGNKMSLGQAIGRYFAYIPAILPLCLGLVWVGIDKKKQGWHDKLAGTVVVKQTK
jgi:uncharacterized RDD family membrane protein YckC